MRLVSNARTKLVFAYLLYSAVSVALAGAFYQNTLRGTLASLEESGTVRLSEAVSRLRLQIDGYRALANVIADNQQMADALRDSSIEDAHETLANFEATYGAWRIDLTDKAGLVLSTSSIAPQTPSYSGALLRAANNNRLGFAQTLENGQRILQLSRGVLTEGNRPSGVVIVSVSLAALEFEWPVSPEPIVFFDPEGLSVSTNRPNLLFLSRGGDPEETAFDLTSKFELGDTTLWKFQPPRGDPLEVIKAEQFVPQLDLTGVIFLDTSDARATAKLRVILVLAGAVVLGLIGTVALQQRRRRVLEEQHSAGLEARVEERTEELRGAQDALVEASKLAALGRLSAGVSHELNQPLAAILNFAENGQEFLARGRPNPAAQNLTLISDQVRRINRIIGNLRAFARQEVAPADKIDFPSVVDAAIDLAADDIRSAKVELVKEIPKTEMIVLAGRVRLEQVVLNLITNALDAMTQSAEKTLDVRVFSNDTNAVLTIRDTGHGIEDPRAVFEPFYSTKDLGASKGLGMGLALSFGIISRFGGTLSCRNTNPGAEFKVTLPLADHEHA
jgi:two-component system C4-dicarboxylate transport sensor histidine kinase DctB